VLDLFFVQRSEQREEMNKKLENASNENRELLQEKQKLMHELSAEKREASP